MILGDPDRPGGAAGDRNVATERDEHARPRLLGDRARGVIGRPGLGGRSEVELDSTRYAQRQPAGVELDLAPLFGRDATLGERPRVALAHERERAVVAGSAERATERRVDAPAGRLGGREGDLDQLGE